MEPEWGRKTWGDYKLGVKDDARVEFRVGPPVPVHDLSAHKSDRASEADCTSRGRRRLGKDGIGTRVEKVRVGSGLFGTFFRTRFVCGARSRTAAPATSPVASATNCSADATRECAAAAGAREQRSEHQRPARAERDVERPSFLDAAGFPDAR